MTIDEQIRRNIEEEPIFIPYIGNDVPIHTQDHPFCDDETCPCHHNQAMHERYCYQPWLDGLMTMDEARSFFYGRQL